MAVAQEFDLCVILHSSSSLLAVAVPLPLTRPTPTHLQFALCPMQL